MNVESQGPPPETVIRPLRETTRLGVGSGVVLALAGGFVIWQATWMSPGWFWFGLGALTALVGLVAAIRVPGSRVILRHDEMVVHGQLWSRTVLRGSITSITPWPMVKWTDSRGRGHTTPVTVLRAGGDVDRFVEHALAGRRTLVEWAGVGGDASSGDAP